MKLVYTAENVAVNLEMVKTVSVLGESKITNFYEIVFTFLDKSMVTWTFNKDEFKKAKKVYKNLLECFREV